MASNSLHCSILKTATLIYKFLHIGNPNYFDSSLRLCNSKYNTRHGQPNSLFLEVPKFVPSVFSSRNYLVLVSRLTLLLYGMISQMTSDALLSFLHLKTTETLPLWQSFSSIVVFTPELFCGAELDWFNGL